MTRFLPLWVAAAVVLGPFVALLKAASDAGWPYAVLVFAGFTALIAWPLSRPLPKDPTQ